MKSPTRLELLYDLGNGVVLNPSLRRGSEGRALAAVHPINSVLANQVRNYNWPIPIPYQFGTRGSGPGQFNVPQGVAISSGGDIVVCDFGNNRIQVFRQDGTFVRQWGSEGTAPGQFILPQSVAVSSTDEVFVVDYGNNRIQVFGLDGSYVRSWGSYFTIMANPYIGTGRFNGPSDVAIHGDLVLVSDRGNYRIQCFRLDGTFVRMWDSQGAAPGQFDYSPSGLAVSAAGEVFVCNSGKNRVQVFDLDGTFRRSWGSAGNAPGQLHLPRSVAVSSAGEVLVSDYTRVQVFLADGTFVRSMNLPADNLGAFLPAGVAVAPSGDVVVSDSRNNRIYVLPEGAW